MAGILDEVDSRYLKVSQNEEDIQLSLKVPKKKKGEERGEERGEDKGEKEREKR